MENEVRLEYVAAQNFGPIKSAEVDFEVGDLFVVSGGNGTGKSTVSQWLFDILRDKFPGNPLKDGELAGYYKARFSNGIAVYYHFDKEGQRLEFYGPESKCLSKQAARLFVRELIGNRDHTFDLDGWIRETQPKKRREAIESLVDVDFRELDERIQVTESSRLEAKRARNTQRARAIEYDRGVAALEKVDPADLLRNINILKGQKSRRESVAHEIQRAKEAQERADKEIRQIEDQINMLRKKIDEELVPQKRSAEEVFKNKMAELASLPVPSDQDIRELEQRIMSASQLNESIAKAKQVEEEHKLLAEFEERVKEAEEQVREAREAKIKAIKQSPLPGGLEFDPDRPDGLLLNGHPIEQAAASEIAIAALALTMEGLDGLKFVHFDASLLDYENCQKVLDYLKSKGYQACIEIAERRKSEAQLRITLAEKYFE